MEADTEILLRRLRRLNAIGIALSAEHDIGHLLERILDSAKDLTHADGGSLYLREGDLLRFELVRTDSLGVRLGGVDGDPIDFPPVHLHDAEGRPNHHMVAAHAVLVGRTVNLPDAYGDTGFDLSGTRDYDARMGYRSRSFLTVPMQNHEHETIGVLQLINARDRVTREVVVFSEADQQLVESLSSQAAVALSNRRLIEAQKRLFEALIQLIAKAIDDKSPYTGGHCRRVPELTMMLADAAAAASEGPLADFTMSEADRYELRIAGWLHDCGKITTPEYVVDKATKLHTLFDRIELVDTRFAVLEREAELRLLRGLLARQDEEGAVLEGTSLEADYARELAELRADRELLHRCNIGGEEMAEEDIQRVRRIAGRRWTTPQGEEAPLLSDEEVENLTVRRGTLTEAERRIVNHHIVATINMLESLPYPAYLRHVPEYAGGHHERMDGRGYPRGLTREQMSVQARVMGIADIFEALTARDRPYKEGMKLSQALDILGRMKLDQHIDPDLFEVFVREKIYLRYAERFLPEGQIDAIDEGRIPGYRRP